MWKKIFKVTMWIIIILGILGTITATICTAVSSLTFYGIINSLVPSYEMQDSSNFFTITLTIITFISGSIITFLTALGMGFGIEIAEDIEQIKINTTPHISRQAEQPKQPEQNIDMKKYMYPYQYNTYQ